MDQIQFCMKNMSDRLFITGKYEDIVFFCKFETKLFNFSLFGSSRQEIYCRPLYSFGG